MFPTLFIIIEPFKPPYFLSDFSLLLNILHFRSMIISNRTEEIRIWIIKDINSEETLLIVALFVLFDLKGIVLFSYT